MYKTDGQTHVEWITRIPDDDYLKDYDPSKTFSGVILVEDWQGHSIDILPSNAQKSIHKKQVLKDDIVAYAPKFWCNTVTYCTCNVGTDFCYHCFDQTTCTGGGGGGIDGGGGTSAGGYGPPHGGGGGGGSTSPSVTFSQTDLETAVFVDDGKPAINPETYIKCYQDGKAASSYAMTIYVDQPVRGKNDQFFAVPIITPGNGIMVNINGVVSSVGHTFVMFEKNNVDGTSVRQIMGFYPDPNDPSLTAKISSKGKIKDDSGHSFDVSYTTSVNAEQFNSSLNKLNSDSMNSFYMLHNIGGVTPEYNCTDAAKNWMGSAGIDILPSSSRGAFKETPGDFGQALLNGSIANNKSPGKAPQGKGPCN